MTITDQQIWEQARRRIGFHQNRPDGRLSATVEDVEIMSFARDVLALAQVEAQPAAVAGEAVLALLERAKAVVPVAPDQETRQRALLEFHFNSWEDMTDAHVAWLERHAAPAAPSVGPTGIALTDDEWMAIEAAHNALNTIAENRYMRSDEAHLHDYRTGTIRDAQKLAAFTLKRFTPVVCRLLAELPVSAPPAAPAGVPHWLSSTRDVSDAEATQSVLKGRSLATVRGDAEALNAAIRAGDGNAIDHLAGGISSEASGSAIPARPTLPGEDALRVPTDEQLADTLDRLVRLAHRSGELWGRCQGKGWSDGAGDEFTRLRDTDIPAIKAELRALLAGGDQKAIPPSSVKADTQLRKALTLGLQHATWSKDRSRDPIEKRLNEQDVRVIEAALALLPPEKT